MPSGRYQRVIMVQSLLNPAEIKFTLVHGRCASLFAVNAVECTRISKRIFAKNRFPPKIPVPPLHEFSNAMNLIRSRRVKKPALKTLWLIMQALGLAYSAAAIAAGETLSIGSKAGDQSSYATTTWSSLSGDGRYLALTGTSGFLPHIFLYDRYTGTSRDLTPLANNIGIAPEISANGQYVVFRSSASNLVTDDSNGIVADIFIHDVRTHKTSLISKASDGEQGNDLSHFAAISGDGQSVAFSSAATNLVANDTNNASDVFMRNRKTGKTIRISVSSTGAQADTGVSNGIVDISGDGRYVVFSSFSNNLTAGDSSSEDIFLRDTQSGVTTRISQPVRATGFDGGSKQPAISTDGRFIVFSSGSSKLVADDTDDLNADIFVYDRTNKKSVKITKNADGSSIMPTISASGRFVGFMSQASNLVADDTNGAWDTFIHDRQTGKTSRINVTAQNLQSTGDSLLLQARPDISADGRFMSFESAAKDLTADDADNVTDVFLRDTLSNKQKSADIRLTVSAPNTALQGRQYSYTFTAANLGPASASQTNVVINLPGTLTVDSVTPAQGSCVKGMVTVCRLGAISSGANKQIQVNVKASAKGAVSISGSAESIEKDGAYSNNSATKTVTIN